MKTMNLIWPVTFLTILLAGCSSRTAETPKSSADQPVKVKVLAIGSVREKGDPAYIGTIEESQSVPLSYTISGTAERVLVEEGQAVHKGQLLAVLNEENYQNARQIAAASAQQAQDAYDRLEPVYKKGSLPEVRFVEAQTGLEKAKSMLSIAEKNLRDCNLYAPTSGIIGRKNIEPGMSVLPGNPVFQLVKIEQVKAGIPVPEKEISGFSKGQKAIVKVSAIGDIPFEGVVDEVGVLSNPLSHTYQVKVNLKNDHNRLKPGMVCTVSIPSSVLSDRVVVPLSAVQQEPDGNKFVYLADPAAGKAFKKSVTTGPLASDGIVINSGLDEGDLLVVSGYQKINEGSLIQIQQ